MKSLFYKLMLLVVIASVSCKSEEDLRSTSGSASGPRGIVPGPSSGMPSTVQTFVAPTSLPSPSVSAEPLTYPLLSFRGNGHLTNKEGNLSVAQNMSASMTAEAVTLQITKFVGNGKYDKQVTDALKGKFGTTVYRRMQNAELDAYAKANPTFNNANFLIFTKSATRYNGKEVVFDRPTPIFLVPDARARYDALDKGAIAYSTKVSSPDGTVICNDMSIRVEVVGATAQPYAAKITNTCNDSGAGGKIYEQIPMPSTATYTIDTVNRVLCIIASMSRFWDKEEKREETSNLTHNLVSSTLNGAPQTVACPI